VNERKFENLNPLDDDATSFLLSLYRWKAYDPIDRHGWLVLASVPTARAFLVVKVGLLVLLAIFVSLNARFPRFFEKLVPENKYNLCFFLHARHYYYRLLY